MRRSMGNQRGSILVIFALTLVVLIGFTALGIEAGQWYLTQAELSKAVDAAALAGAANVSNPYLGTNSAQIVASDFATENFQTGYLGTPESGSGAASFSIQQNQQTGVVTVTGQTDASSTLAGVLGVNNVAVKSAGAAVMGHVQIILVLDRSGSMQGQPISDLQNAVKAFVGFFEDPQIQAQDKIGLVSFATAPGVGGAPDVPLEYNYYTAVVNAAGALNASGATNQEAALEMAGNQFTDESQVDPADRIPQYIVFFTDGRPTAFTSTFKTTGKSSTEIVLSYGNCDNNTVADAMCGVVDPNSADVNSPTPSCTQPTPTGDGRPPGLSVCPGNGNSSNNGNGPANWKWGSFASYPISSLGPESFPKYCNVPTNLFNGQDGYVCQTAHEMTIDVATALKNRDVQIYCIGLGNEVDKVFLGKLASTSTSGRQYLYLAPNSSQLQSIFSKIAQDIKLRLVQ